MAKLGIVKNYLKFSHDVLFGVIGCSDSNIVFIPDRNGNIGTLCMIGFAEKVIIWNLRTYEIEKSLPADKFELSDKVTYLSYFYTQLDGVVISIGYESGYVVLYSLWTDETLLTSKFHRHPISYIMHCEPLGTRIICGSKDTTISVYDKLTESGYKLEGHKSVITKLHYILKKDVLISSSQDGNIKFWFLEQKRCFKTLTNPSEIWDFNFLDDRNLLITGSSDLILRLSLLEYRKIDNDPFSETTTGEKLSNVIQANPVPGEVIRQTNKRVVELKVDKTGSYMICNSRGKSLELYKILNEAELKKRLQKKIKKATKTSNGDAQNVILQASDRLRLIKILELPYRCTSIDLCWDESKREKEEEKCLQILASMNNNTVALFSLNIGTGSVAGPIDTKKSITNEFSLKRAISHCGHRTAVIHCQMTSDKTGLLTASLSEVKLWSLSSLNCLKTIGWTLRDVEENGDVEQFEQIYSELGLAKKYNLDANAALLLPGDRHAVIGFKNGVMFVIDFVTISIIQWMKKHEDSISSLVLSQDQSLIMSGSADKSLKFWKLEYSKLHKAKDKVQLVCRDNGEQFKQGITSIAVTPDGKLIIIGFLDNKVRTYLSTDTSRRVLDLYGHTQPVMSISVKYDNTQVLTGSGDKTVRSWNLPHGDCKIFKGHTEAVTDVRYIPGRSMAFSSDRSGLIIQIDLKNMREIIRLHRHHSSISCLAVDAIGTEADEDGGDNLGNALLISVATDRSIRQWNETDNILTRESEEMEENEKDYEKSIGRDDIIKVGAPKDTGINVLTIKSLKTERSADEIIEAIDIYDQIRIDPTAPVNPKMAASKIENPDQYVMHILSRIKGADLETVLAQLPISYVSILLPILADFVQRDINLELAERCFSFLAKLHFLFVKSNLDLYPSIEIMAKYARLHYQRCLDINGYNRAAFDYHRKIMGPEFITFTEQRSIKKTKSKKNKN